VFGQPADAQQAAQRPPCADRVGVDTGAVAGEHVAEVFSVAEGEGGEVEQGVARAHF
jgi:hypothetical protein